MSIVSAVILGILQGLTEFLPVSSSGHLAIGKHILDFESKHSLAYFLNGFKKIILKIKDFYGVSLLHQYLQQ